MPENPFAFIYPQAPPPRPMFQPFPQAPDPQQQTAALLAALVQATNGRQMPSTAPMLAQSGGVGGGGNAPGASPDQSSAPSLANNGQGFFGGLTSGPNTGLSNMAINIAQGNTGQNNTSMTAPTPGLLSGNFTGQGALNTALGLGSNLGLNALGLGALSPAGLMTAALGPLAQAFTNIGQVGSQTNGELSGPIGEGLGLAGTGPNVNANVAAAIAQGLFGGRSGQDSDPNAPSPGGPSGGPGGPGGPGGNSGAPSGGGDDGNPGSYRVGGTVKKTGPALVHRAEEVVRASEARKPAVRAALKDINQPGESDLERAVVALVGGRRSVARLPVGG